MTPTAEAQSYTFTNIADDTGPLNGFFVSPVFPGPAINDSGEVAFLTTLDAGGRGIFKGSGGPLTTIALTGGSFLNFTWQPVINNAGNVAFEVELPGSGFGGQDSIWVGNGVTTSPVITSPIPFAFGYTPGAINNSGVVGFHVSEATGFHFLMTGVAGGTAGVVYGAGTGFVGGFLGKPDLNDTPELAMVAAALGGGFGIYRGISVPPTPIALSATDEFALFNAIAMNNAGQIAFWAELDVVGSGVFIGDDSGVTTVAVAGESYSVFGPVGINDSGDVAFSGLTMAGVVGIFTGSNPAADKVIVAGDSLFGSTVTDVAFFRGLNNSGQVAFFYLLANSVSGVAVATPSPTCAPADLNCDGVVNTLDLGILLSSWSIPPTAPGCGGTLPCPADINGDGVVNSLDLGILLSSWTL